MSEDERERLLSVIAGLREAAKAVADRNVVYDGGAVVIETAAHWQAIRLMANLRTALRAADDALAADEGAKG